MDLDLAATIAWCLMGAMMVGVVLMYGCMHRFIRQAYDEGWQDSLSRVPTAISTVRHQETAQDTTPTPAPRPPAALAS